MNRVLVSCVVIATLATPSISLAAQPGKENPKAQGNQVVVTFAMGQRDAAQSWFVEQRGKGACPPGLAKKNNGCLPPGQAKKRYAIGHALPAGIVIQAVPGSLSMKLGAPPVGFTYGFVDGDLLKLAVGTMLVVDAISSL